MIYNSYNLLHLNQEFGQDILNLDIARHNLAMNILGPWTNIARSRVSWFHLVYFCLFSHFQDIISYLVFRYISANLNKPDQDFLVFKLIYYVLAMVLALHEAISVTPALILIILEIF